MLYCDKCKRKIMAGKQLYENKYTCITQDDVIKCDKICKENMLNVAINLEQKNLKNQFNNNNPFISKCSKCNKFIEISISIGLDSSVEFICPYCNNNLNDDIIKNRYKDPYDSGPYDFSKKKKKRFCC